MSESVLIFVSWLSGEGRDVLNRYISRGGSKGRWVQEFVVTVGLCRLYPNVEDEVDRRIVCG